MSRIYRKVAATLATWAVVGTLASCSVGGSAAQTEANAEGLVPLKVGVLTTATNAPIFMGVERGLFKEQGLDVQLEVLTSGATTVPSLLNNSLQFAYTGAPSTLIARSKGLPVKIVANAGTTDNTPILVKTGSPIQSVADLRGKRVGVSSLGSLPEISLVSALMQAGLKREDVQLLEVPLPDATQALDSGSVDAVWSTPPFSTIALNSGNYRSLGLAISGDMLGLGNAVFITTEPYLEANKETAKKFAEGVRASNEYAAAHVDEMLATVPTFTKIPAGTLSAADVKSDFGPFRVDRLEAVNNFMVQAGFLKEPVQVNQLVWDSISDAEH